MHVCHGSVAEDNKNGPPMEAAGFTDQVIILNYADQVSADYASVLNIQLTFLASQLSRKKRLIIVLLRSWKMNLNF